MKNGGGTGTTPQSTQHKRPQTRSDRGYRSSDAACGQNLLVRIKSLLPAHCSRCHALTVNNPNAWFSLSTGLGAHIAAEKHVDVLPCPIITLGSIIVPDMIPGLYRSAAYATDKWFWYGRRWHSREPDIDSAFLATPGLLCNLRCNQVKLPVIQIAWVTFGRVWCGSFGVVVAGHRRFLRSTFRTVQDRRPQHDSLPHITASRSQEHVLRYC